MGGWLIISSGRVCTIEFCLTCSALKYLTVLAAQSERDKSEMEISESASVPLIAGVLYLREA